MYDLAVFLRILFKWSWLIALLVAATAVTMWVIALGADPMYRSTVTIQISAPPPQEVPLFSTVDREAISQQIERTRDNVATFLQTGDVVRRMLERLPEIDMTESELSKLITVDLPTNSQLMDVSVVAPEPEMAALLANTIAEVGQEYYAELLAEPTELARVFIEGQLERAEGELLQAEYELEAFRIQHGIYDLESAMESQNILIRELNRMADEAMAEGRADAAASYLAVLATRQAELQKLIQLVPEYNQFDTRVRQKRQDAEFLVDKRNEAFIKVNQILAMSTIRVISPARIPRNQVPVFGNAIILLSVISALAAGVMLALLLEFLEISGLRNRSALTREETSAPGVS
jgi:uncharacterized protein involved in exopolysaccharide biosynthesis